jgi:hypothetical protein
MREAEGERRIGIVRASVRAALDENGIDAVEVEASATLTESSAAREELRSRMEVLVLPGPRLARPQRTKSVIALANSAG